MHPKFGKFYFHFHLSFEVFSDFLFFFNILFILFVYFWLHWVFIDAQPFSSCGERGLLFIVGRGFLIEVSSLVVEHGL